MSYYSNSILMVSPLGYTGIAYYDHSLCRALSEIGQKVTLITSKERIVKADLPYAIHYYFVNTYGKRSRIVKGINYLVAFLRITFFVIFKQVKMVHFQILELPPVDKLFFSFLKMLGVKIVFTPHDICSFKGNKDKLLVKQYQLADGIIVHNQANKDLLVDKFNIAAPKITVIAHGNYNYFLRSNITKEEARGKIDLPKNKKIVMMFGNIRQGKGIDTAIDAIAALKNRNDFLFLIAGKASKDFDIVGLKEKINLLGLSNLVIMRDHFIDDSVVEYYYKGADIVLVPYEKVYESGVLRYAFSCGTPSIVSSIKEFSDFVVDKENCLIFKACDSADMAKKISNLLDDHTLATKIGIGAQRYSDKHWGWQDLARQTKLLYEKVFATKS